VFCVGYVALIAFMFSYQSRRMIQRISRPSRTASLLHRLLAQMIAKTRLWWWIPRSSPAVGPSEGLGAPAQQTKRSLSVLRRLSTARQQVVSRFIFEFTDKEGLYHEYHVSLTVHTTTDRLLTLLYICHSGRSFRHSEAHLSDRQPCHLHERGLPTRTHHLLRTTISLQLDRILLSIPA